jgi:hypothetical protein
MEVKEMATRTVELRTNERVFEGLSKQNMLFHQCVFELCDNAIAATQDDKKANINVAFEAIPDDDEHFYLYVCDDGVGMDADLLEKSLQLGHEPTSNSRLNEHGFGLKNSLATLSGGNKEWTLWTRKKGEERQNILYVEGPFKPKMEIIDEATTVFPDKPFISPDVSTVIKTKVKMSYAQTVQGRGAKAKSLQTFRAWLVEHLGVAYRGYLSLDETTNDTKARITVSIGNDRYSVTPIHVPIAAKQTKYFQMELGGEIRDLVYNYGTLDEVKRDKLVKGQKAKYYYQGNMSTQGIDIRLGDRVIATRQFETIWRESGGGDDGKPLERHNSYNDFVGELLIPELPRGVLTTVNNKTDFNLDDIEWVRIFEKMNEYRPTKHVREKSESDLKKAWMKMLKATNPDESINDEHSVWPTGVRIDVYRKRNIPGISSSITIYELKVGEAKPIDLYQLKMYWDGLILAGEQPDEAVLMVEDYNTNIEEMANRMNTLTPPNMPGGDSSKPYNFKLTKHSDVNL